MGVVVKSAPPLRSVEFWYARQYKSVLLQSSKKSGSVSFAGKFAAFTIMGRRQVSRICERTFCPCAIHAKNAQIRRRLCVPHIWYPNQGGKEQTADTCARIVLYGTELHQIVNRSGAVCRADEPVFHSVRHI